MAPAEGICDPLGTCSSYGSYGPFLTLKNGFSSISFENISVLDSLYVYKIQAKFDLG